MIGSAVGSAYVMLTKVLAISPGAAGLPGIISIRPTSIVNYTIAMILSMVVAVRINNCYSKVYEQKTSDK